MDDYYDINYHRAAGTTCMCCAGAVKKHTSLNEAPLVYTECDCWLCPENVKPIEGVDCGPGSLFPDRPCNVCLPLDPPECPVLCAVYADGDQVICEEACCGCAAGPALDECIAETG